MKKRFYSKELKLQAIAMAEERENISAVARELDIRADMLRRWIREYHSKQSEAFSNTSGKPKDRKLSEIQRLKKEIKELKVERDIPVPSLPKY